MASLRSPVQLRAALALCCASKHACSTPKRFEPNSGPSKQFVSFHVASWERADYRRLRHMEWECRPWLFTPSCGWAVLNLLCIVQPGPQPCLEALLSRFLGRPFFLSSIRRSSMAAILMPRSGLCGRLAEALGCRSAALRSFGRSYEVPGPLLLQQYSHRSRHSPC